eukprot:365204-Chlamydomonas_euryale.AAC.5
MAWAKGFQESTKPALYFCLDAGGEAARPQALSWMRRSTIIRRAGGREKRLAEEADNQSVEQTAALPHTARIWSSTS